MNFITNFIKPKQTLEDLKRKEFILNVLLTGSISLAGFVTFYLSYYWITIGKSEEMVSPLFPAVIFLIFIGLMALSKKGKITLASYLLIFIFLLPAIYLIYFWGAGIPMALLIFVVLIIMGGILINTKFSFWLTIFISAILLFLSYSQLRGITSPDLSWRAQPFNIGDSIVVVITFCIIASISWLSNREIERSLRRARASEADLKKERDMLEVRVKERTKEIEKIQLEKMEQMAHFAEFGQIASGVFHDILNPLTAVSLNLSEASSAKTQNLKTAKPYIEEALRATKKAEEFASAVSKQIKQQVVSAAFNPFKEIEQVMKVIGYKTRKEKVEIKLEGDRNILLVGNPLKFHRSMTNLLINAIDAYSNTRRATKIVAITLFDKKSAVEIEISDHGIGIDKDLLSRIFEPFVTTKKTNTGTGIGLSIVKHTIEDEFSGTISVESELGKGTLFTLVIPKSK